MRPTEFESSKDTATMAADRRKPTALRVHAFFVLSLVSVACFLLFSEGLRTAIGELWALVEQAARVLGMSS